MKKFILFTFVALLSITAKAQQQDPLIKLVSNHSIGINLVGAEYQYERHVKGNFTVSYIAGLATNLYMSNDDFSYTIIPKITLEPRYYYNFDKRVNKIKNTRYNSANYVALKARILFPFVHSNFNPVSSFEFQLAPVWGMKRVFINKLFIDGYLGFGVSLIAHSHDIDFGYGAMAGVKIGYIFK